MIEPLIFDADDPRWLRLIEKDPAATIFHHPAWMEMLSAAYGYRPFVFAIPDRNGQVCAAIPIAEVKNLLKSRRYVALPFTDYCRPLFRDEESFCLLADTLVKQQQAARFSKLEIRSALPAQANIQTYSPFVLHTVPLDSDFTRVAKRANRQQMQNVRKAEKNDVRIVRGTGLAEVRAFYRLHSLNRRKHGVPVQPWNFFQLLTRLLLEQGLGFVLLAHKEDACISGGLFLHWQRTLTYKYSATDNACLNLSPNHLVTWAAMKWGCENGFTTFDFGRAELDDEGLRAYKCRWGADEIPLVYSYIPSASGMIARRDGRISTMLKKVIRRSPVWVGQVIGRIMYRYVG
jgi:CelD/BcsL family acetyltransferase involved in cellulose biosynthesis